MRKVFAILAFAALIVLILLLASLAESLGYHNILGSIDIVYLMAALFVIIAALAVAHALMRNKP